MLEFIAFHIKYWKFLCAASKVNGIEGVLLLLQRIILLRMSGS